MAQDITLLGATYPDVPAVTLPKSGGGTAMFIEETELANAGTQTPLPDSSSGDVGSSTSYAREDHVHPVKTYLYWNVSSHFLQWVLDTFTSNGSYYVVLANGDYTDLPEQSDGVAIVQYRNGYRTVELTALPSGNVYKNSWNSGWIGWSRFLFDTDFVSSASYSKLPDGTLIQWGKVTGLTFSNQTLLSGQVTLPVDFVDTSYIVTASPSTTSNNAYLFRAGASASTKSVFDWVLGSGSGSNISISNRLFTWTAIGRWK